MAQSKTIGLPLDGEWLSVGGLSPKESHSWGLLGQRYAYDFIQLDENNKSQRVDPPVKPEDFFAFGKPVNAVLDGTVVEVQTCFDDGNIFGRADATIGDARGNYVTVQHEDRFYSTYAHLKQGSVLVHKGDQVLKGQKIAEVGHTGASTEPHLHFQIQDRKSFFYSASLPIEFIGKNNNKFKIEKKFSIVSDSGIRKVLSISELT